MVFDSPVFLFLFFPVFAGVYFLSPAKLKNIILILFSLLFYFWADRSLVLILLLSCLVNYIFGWIIGNGYKRTGLVTSVIFNVSLLFFYKYLTPIIDTGMLMAKNSMAEKPGFSLADIAIPLGISFYTFRAISYSADIYRGKVERSRNFLEFLTYFTLFPLMIAGPIVRYADICGQLSARVVTVRHLTSGIERIIIGLAKKILIAGTFSRVATLIFDAPAGDVSTLMAWTGIIAFAFEIYYDFSGYTDIAIGIGKLIGFDFQENFNYPYVSRNIREFWRRWHISLSAWLRDYIFLPLAYMLSRRLPGNKYFQVRTENIIYLIVTGITFLICGLWHGAGLHFVAWGIYFAFFLVLEQLFLGRILRKFWVPLQHAYTLLVVVCSWVLFKSGDLSEAFGYFEKMFTFSHGLPAFTSYLVYFIFTGETLAITLIALLLATPAYPRLKAAIFSPAFEHPVFIRVTRVAGILILGVLLIVSISYMAENTYNPFIYMRF